MGSERDGPTEKLVGGEDALRVLGSATRQEIVDALTSGGPVTIAELAEMLGRKADALYFHVRMLVKAGLVVERDSVTVHGRSTAVYAVPAPIRLDYAAGARRELARVVRQAVRLAAREFERACMAGADAGAGNQRELWGGRVMGWVSDDELARVNGLIAELHAVLRGGRRGAGRRAVSLGFVLSPAGFGERIRRPKKRTTQ